MRPCYVLSCLTASRREYYCADGQWRTSIALAARYLTANEATNMARTLQTAIGAYVTVEVRS